jgi:hypothetical protein
MVRKIRQRQADIHQLKQEATDANVTRKLENYELLAFELVET